MFNRFRGWLAAILLVVLGGVTASIVGHSDTPPASLDVHYSADYPGRLFVGSDIVYDGTPTTTTEASTSTESASTTTTVEPSTSTTTLPSTSSTTTVPASTSTSTSTTTTSLPSPSSTSPATSSTSSTPSSTAPSTSTSSSSPPTTTTPGSSACGLASAAFCETFDAPHNGGTQTGDLDPVVWGVSRVADFDISQGKSNGITPSHNACSGSAVVVPPADVRVCGGQYVDSVNDGGAIVDLDAYPKQPFNFAGRTGKVVFDVSDDTTGSHGDWPEFLITDEPVPGVLRCISECELGSQGTVTAKNEIGFSLDSDQTGACPGTAGVGTLYTSANGVYSNLNFTRFDNCLTLGSRTAMNHFEVDLSTTRIDIYGTNAGSSTLKHLIGAPLNLGWSQGLVWINDVHYNARKAVEPCACGTHYDHSFAWDNLGFDGPDTYRDRGFDVPYKNDPNNATNQNGDSVEVQEGYNVGTGPVTLSVAGVNWSQTPTAAKVVLNSHNNGGSDISVSVNGGAQTHHALASGFHTQTFSIVVPLSDVHTGTNTLTFRSNNGSVQVANVSLILVAAAPVP